MNLKCEKGQTTVIVVLFIPIFILLLGWSVDVGRVLAAKAELAKASDIAAYELAKEISIDVASVTGENVVGGDLNQQARDWVEKNIGNLSGGSLKDVATRLDSQLNPKIIYVKAKAEVPLLFSQFAGLAETEMDVLGQGRIRRVK